MNNLTEMMLGDICRLGAGNAFPKDKQGNTSGEVPFIKVSDFELPGNEVRINRANNYVSASTANELRLKRYRKGSTAFAKIGIALTYNRRRKLCSDTAVDNNLMVAEADLGVVSDDYLYYLLRTIDFNLIANGSAIPYLNAGDIKKIPVFIHDTHEQESITRILKTLDDKIELNRKTNETLEAMAKALFKSWFVDFDPVRAKAEGRSTGLPAEISDLFPDSFEDSELGEIPSGWSVVELGDCCLDIESGRRPKGGIDKNLAFGIPSIGAESIAPVGQFDFTKTKWVESAFAESAGKGWIQNFDVALYKDGGKPGEFRPRTALYGDGFPFEKAMINEHVFLLRSSQLGQPYLYYLFNFDLVLAQIIHKGSSKGAQPGLNQDEVRTSSFVKPTKYLLDIFNRTVEPGIRKQLLLGKECQALSELRDSLLPKLISGEIRIPDAERMLEEVGV